MTDLENFCENVERIMKQEGLTKKEMCKVMHISLESLNLILSKNIPKRTSVKVLFNLSKFFRKPPAWFFTENDI